MAEKFNRRDALVFGGALAAGGVLSSCGNSQSAASQEGSSESAGAQDALAAKLAAPHLDFGNARWNRDTLIKLQGNTDSEKQKWGWYAGRVIGVRDGEPNKHVCDFEGFSVARMIHLGDGNYRKLLREVGFYLDKDTGEIMETMINPYTGEKNNVVPIANDPFNVTFEEYWPEPPSYGGLNTERPPRRPLLLNWRDFGDRILLHTDIHLFYPSALQPTEWPRESPGPMTQVSEFFSYNILKADMLDPNATTIKNMGVWNRTTPWFPWMLMDQSQGQMVYVCDFASRETSEGIPQKILDAAKAIDPKYLEAPYEDYGPNLSSLENYKLTQTPAPAK